VQLRTLPELIEETLSPPRERAFGERLGAPDWRYLTSVEMLTRARALACALRAAGLQRGDRVGIVSNNRLDWLAADFGILLAGCVVVPIFATLALDQVEYIFADSEMKLAFVESAGDVARIAAACNSAPRFVHFDGTGPGSLLEFEAAGNEALAADPESVASFTSGTASDDLAVLIYTSGTTGNPKGVMLTHGNLFTNSYEAFHVGFKAIKPGDPVLSVLPFAHIYEHTDVLGFIQFDCQLHVTQPEFLVADLRDVRPRTIALVPRIYERVLASVVSTAKAAGGAKARLVPWALETGRAYMATVTEGGKPSPGSRLSYALAKRLVLSKIRPLLGLDRVEFLVSGSAPLHRDIALTFASLGIPICEGYGLTETSPVVSANTMEALRYGSVGRPIPGVTVKIAADGEILVKGPNVMKGYYHLAGESPFDADGWFMTGDIGRLDADGFLFITDRKKELIKTSGGKYVAPSRVEAAIKRSVYVAQALVLGDGRPFPMALVAPNWPLLKSELELSADTDQATACTQSVVIEFVRRQVVGHTADLATFEQVRRIALLPRELTIEDGELSPTLKVKRRIVERKFADLIESAYREPATAGSRP
jgi:long-chain acyl-CoA synthetase